MKKIYNFVLKLITRLIILAFLAVTAVGIAILFKPSLLIKANIYPFDEERVTGIKLVENDSSMDTNSEMCLIIFIDNDYFKYLGEVTNVTLAINSEVETYELTDSYSKHAYKIYIEKTTDTIEFATEKSLNTSYDGYVWKKVVYI